jgi:aminoglycoside phosphotransferase (APT) family kinase protein
LIGQLSRLIERNWEALGLARPPHPSGQRWLVMNGGIGAESKLGCLMWAENGSQPNFVVKFARYPIYNGRLEDEYLALQTMQRLTPGGLVPTPLLAFHLNDLFVTVETALPGRLLRLYLREHPHRHRQTLRGFEPLVRWLMELHRHSARPAADAEMRAFVLEPLEASVKELGDFSTQEVNSVDRLYSLAKELLIRRPLPIVFNHSDLTATNLLVGEDGALSGIIDWEFAAPGLPLLDLFYFLASYGYEARGTTGGLPLRGFRELSFLPASTARGALPIAYTQRWLDAYCRVLRVDPEWLPILFGLTWLLHARNERRRFLMLRGQGQASGDNGTSNCGNAGEQAHFRSHLRYFLENMDSSLVAGLAWGFRR